MRSGGVFLHTAAPRLESLKSFLAAFYLGRRGNRHVKNDAGLLVLSKLFGIEHFAFAWRGLGYHKRFQSVYEAAVVCLPPSSNNSSCAAMISGKLKSGDDVTLLLEGGSAVVGEVFIIS
jgi:hypothetical protein